MNKHTPGPWIAHALMVSEAGQPIGRYRDICHCGLGMRSPSDAGESEANARLIAAAPELLLALQAVINDRHDLDMVPSNERGRTTTAFELAVSAIAKAKGEA